MRLKGKVALLTGAAAALDGELMGFGGAVAHRFVGEGAKIILESILKTFAGQEYKSVEANFQYNKTLF